MTALSGNINREARLWRHPGPVHNDRFEIGSEYDAKSSRVTLAPGLNMVEAISKVVKRLPDGTYHCASVMFLGGIIETCVFCLAELDPTGHTVATYTPMTTLKDVSIIDGAATFGRGVDGGLLVHCHAWFSDSQGRLRGGHFDPFNSIIGPDGLQARITEFSSLRLQQTPDAETNHAVFMPTSQSGASQ